MNYPFYKKMGYVGIRQDKDLVFFKKDRNNNYDKLWSRQIARRDRKHYVFWQFPCISTHTPLARRDFSRISIKTDVSISTHTPLARRDFERLFGAACRSHFYSHASREA